MQHAGRAVVFSGLTVAIGLLSMIVLPVPMLRSVGYGGVLVPLVSVAVAVTLLPVILASAGPRLDWPRLRHRAAARRGCSPRGRRCVYRHRWVSAAAGLAIMGAADAAGAVAAPGRAGQFGGGDRGAGARRAGCPDVAAACRPGCSRRPRCCTVCSAAPAVAARAAGLPGVYAAVVAPATPRLHVAGGTSIVTVLPATESSRPGRAGRDAPAWSTRWSAARA